MMFITTEFNGHTTAAREQHLWCSAEAPLRWSLISPHLEENPLSHNCRNPQPNLQNPAYASMKSNNSVIQPFTFSNKGEPPEPSYVSMKSNNSMIQCLTFSNKGEHPEPSYVSMKSNNSIIQPLTFSNKGEPPASSGRSGLVQDQSRCGVCEQVLTDPVLITCGHSFCRRCINSFRNRTALSEDFICPCCRKRSTTLPVLHPDIEESINQDSYQLVDDVLQSVLQKHKTSMKNRYKSL
ncbi:uncharacterized protein LOC111191703 [Astyanax mexicanus]|uniref:uncharacterized protein LOC111191703 n=1 Tax=Astyanax mexicanus TaxID=7994 RepID=UPI0020CAE292|nr:uncharacterized protein LOC111191703 [Astyanax mexicanus]XP_049339231.1 uncharacterized protein LOC111191703 [Astyanax mexicanus]